jgi:putative membrane protein
VTAVTAVSVFAAVLAGLLHLAIFGAESFRWRSPVVWQRFGIADQKLADATRFLAFNQGFYNLFLAVGALAGSACVVGGACRVGWTLLVTACASMVAAAAVLRLGGGAFYTRAAIVQATFPTIALLAAIVVAA